MKTNKMCEEEKRMSESVSADSDSESEIDSIDLLMESFVNLVEMYKELEKVSKRNSKMLEKVCARLEEIDNFGV